MDVTSKQVNIKDMIRNAAPPIAVGIEYGVALGVSTGRYAEPTIAVIGTVAISLAVSTASQLLRK